MGKIILPEEVNDELVDLNPISFVGLVNGKISKQQFLDMHVADLEKLIIWKLMTVKNMTKEEAKFEFGTMSHESILNLVVNVGNNDF